MNNTTKPRFKTPILSTLYRFSGCILLIIGSVILIAGGLHNMASIGMGLGLCFIALVAFGIAQVVTAICETAFNTRRFE
jgi:hypothetical protein